MGGCTSCVRSQKDKTHDSYGAGSAEFDKKVSQVLHDAIDTTPSRKDLHAAAVLWKDEKQRNNDKSNAALRMVRPMVPTAHPRPCEDELFRFAFTLPPWWDLRPTMVKNGVRYQRVLTSGRRKSAKHHLCDAEVHLTMLKLESKCKAETRAKLAKDLFHACGGTVLKSEILNCKASTPLSVSEAETGADGFIGPLLTALNELAFHGVAEYPQPDGSKSHVEQFVIKGPHPKLMMEIAFVTSNAIDVDINRDAFRSVGRSLRCAWVGPPARGPLHHGHPSNNSLVSNASSSTGSSLDPSFAMAFTSLDPW